MHLRRGCLSEDGANYEPRLPLWSSDSPSEAFSLAPEVFISSSPNRKPPSGHSSSAILRYSSARFRASIISSSVMPVAFLLFRCSLPRLCTETQHRDDHRSLQLLTCSLPLANTRLGVSSMPIDSTC